MGTINDSSNIFTGDLLDLFNTMETLVARDGDVQGAQARLAPVMKQIIEDQQTSTGASDPTGATDTPRP